MLLLFSFRLWRSTMGDRGTVAAVFRGRVCRLVVGDHGDRSRRRRGSSRFDLAVVAVVVCLFVVAVPAQGVETKRAGVASRRGSATTRGVPEPITVRGSYAPFTGDFSGTGLTDIFWYAPGSAADSLWLSSGSDPPSTHNAVAQQVNGLYQPLVGNFAGDDRDDIFWYGPGIGPDSLWMSSGAAGHFMSQAQVVNGSYKAIVGRFAGNDTYDDLYWYSGAPSGADALWRSNGDGTFTTVYTAPTRADAMPVVGNFRGGSVTDILFYRPGPRSDDMAIFDPPGPAPTFVSYTVSGTYTPVVGDFYGTTPQPGSCGSPTIAGDRVSDILWYAAGPSPDTAWQFLAPIGAYTTRSFAENGTYRPILLHRSSRAQTEDCYFYGDADDVPLWYSPANGTLKVSSTSYSVPKNAITLSGDFNGSQTSETPGGSPHDLGTFDETDVLFYRPGAAASRVIIDPVAPDIP